MGEALRMAEVELQAAIVDAAWLRGWLVYHTFDSRRSPGGFPDLVLARAGSPLFMWELKGTSGRVKIDQQHWLDVLGDVAGVDARVVYPQDLENALEALKLGRWPG